MGKRTYYPTQVRIEKLSRKEILNLTFDLINAFRIVKTPFETALLMQDLLTASEIKHLAKRLRIAKLLIQGLTQRQIANEVRCSTATVIKVNAWLTRGGEGLRNVIAKLPGRYELPEKLPNIPLEFQLPQTLLALAQYSVSKKQTAQLEKFWGKVEDKELLDKQLRELFNEEYRHRKRS